MRKFMNVLQEGLNEDTFIDKNSAPPVYDDKDAEHYAARDRTGFFGAQASGCILMAKTTGRIMLVHRSSMVDQPHSWGNLGGAHGADERPVDAASREAHEESGYTKNITMVPLLVFVKGTFRYSNFLGLVDDEFTPHLGWEADDFRWVKIGDWPTPLHFGMESLFDDPKSYATITHYASMFETGNHALEGVSEDVDINAAIRAADKIKADLDAEADAENPKPDVTKSTGTIKPQGSK